MCLSFLKAGYCYMNTQLHVAAINCTSKSGAEEYASHSIFCLLASLKKNHADRLCCFNFRNMKYCVPPGVDPSSGAVVW